MRDEMTKASSTPSGAANDPLALSRQSFKPARRKRFYTTAAVAPSEAGFDVLLDQRPMLTPAKARLALPTRAAAEAIAAEWQAQGEEIDPTQMPLTRIVNSALDGVAKAMDAVKAEIAHYAETDLVCYRAGGPEGLVKAQAEAWDCVLAFAEADFGARFFCAEGVMHVAQPEASQAAVRAKLDCVTGSGPEAPIALACLSVMTGLTGSVLITLARVSGALTLEEAWAAAHVDEDFQMRLWGVDEEAMQRRAHRLTEMAAADRLWQLLRG